jgi:molybdenum cofactor cytidylyltransferase
VAGLEHVDARCEALVLMLGDQPGVGVANVEALLDGRGDAPMAACAYRDGRGHPLVFARSMFGELAELHGDKAVWRLMDRRADEVTEVAVEGPTPLDVDTWEDYRRVLLAAAGD